MKSHLYKAIADPIKKCIFLLVSFSGISHAKKTIHIVRLDAIGDFILFSGILPYFRKIYPGYVIVLIIDAVNEKMATWLNENKILGGQSSYFDELIAIDGKRYNRSFFYYYAMLKKIRMSAPEIVIQPTFSRTSKSDDIVFISKESEKIAYLGDTSNMTLRHKKSNDTKYDRLIVNPKQSSEPNTNKHFLNELAGHQVVLSGIPVWHIPESLQSIMKNTLELMGIDIQKPMIAVCPGSSRKIKNWPAENFISLIRQLSAYSPNAQFILIGGKKEINICSEIQKNTGIKNIYNACGQFELPELAGILSLMTLYIGNDTGALHMASAVGISTIGIMSGENGDRFFPYQAWGVGAKNVPVVNMINNYGVNGITVKDVFNEVVKFTFK